MNSQPTALIPTAKSTGASKVAQCLTKIQYKDRAIATRVAEQYTRTNYQGRTFRVYVCRICGEMHLSSKALRGRK